MALTRPDESVVDLKGEIVFRPRATYPVLEKLTRSALARGRLRDRLAQDVLRTHAMVAVADNPGFPPRGRAFLNRNFVRAECLRVAGKIVSGETFEIELPGDYAVVTPRGAFTGALDGIPYAGPRFLGRGRHTLVAPASIRAVIWQRAAARGETPFVTDRRCAEFFIY
jgi:hypothetical protein